MCDRSLGGNLEKKQANEWLHAFSCFLKIMDKISILNNKRMKLEDVNDYESPVITVVEVEVEKGFAGSLDMLTEEGEL